MDTPVAQFNPRSVLLSAMDSPKTHSVIACASCAKAKAKCDKKVPCSRCNIKQIVCAARTTRRSAHNQTRRNQPSRPKPERSIHASGTFQVSQVPQAHLHPGHNQGINGSPSHMVNHQIILPLEQGLPETQRPIPTPIMSARLAPAQSIPLAPVMMNQRMGSSMLPNGYTHTPPEMTMVMGMPMTPMVSDIRRMDNFQLMHSYEPQHDHFLAFHDAQASMLDFDQTNFMPDLMTPPAESSYDHSEQFQRANEQFQMSNHLGMPTPSHIPLPMPVRDGSGPFGLGLDMDSPNNTDYRANAGFSSSSSSATSPVPESDGAIAARNAGILALHSEIAAQHTGSLLQCNHVCMVCWTSMPNQSY